MLPRNMLFKSMPIAQVALPQTCLVNQQNKDLGQFPIQSAQILTACT